MSLSEEDKEEYRKFIESLQDMVEALYKMPTDPVTSGMIEMAAEMIERQIELDIAFPIEDNRLAVHESAPMIITPQNIPTMKDIDEITDPSDLNYLGKGKNDGPTPSADDIQKWFDGYSPN